jgi:hypothetical protein
MSKSQVTQAARATTGTEPQPGKPKGLRPTHRISRVIENNGERAYQNVGAMWPHKDGNGFSIRLKADLKASDNILVRSTKFGGAS